jgi:rRNA maturation endonuclease Nob1
MSIAIYCNDCKKFVSLDLQENCESCGSHSVGAVDLLQGVTPEEVRRDFRQNQLEVDESTA